MPDVDVIEANKQLVLRYFEKVWRDGDFEAGAELVAADVRNNEPPGYAGPSGYEALRFGVSMFKQVFADLWIEPRLVVADESTVAVRSIIHGRHVGPFLGFEPTGREIAQPNADFYGIRDGVIVDHSDVIDVFTALRQLNLLSPEFLVGAPPPRDR